jgi:hypothetical protein
MSLVSGTTPDLAAIKQRQQAIWASGDYHMIGTQILIVSELLIETLDLRSTERVLDVATGSGMPRLRPPGAAAPSSASTNANNVPPPVACVRRFGGAPGNGFGSSSATPSPRSHRAPVDRPGRTNVRNGGAANCVEGSLRARANMPL